MEEKRNSKKKIIIAMIIILLIVAAVFIVFIIMKQKNEKPADKEPNTRTSEIILEAEHAVEKTDPGYFTIQMKMEAFSENGLNFDGEIANAFENKNQVYAIIRLNDTGEELFKSDLLPVGNKIDAFTINRKLGPGKYDAVLSFVSVEEDGTTEISEVKVEYILNVF